MEIPQPQRIQIPAMTMGSDKENNINIIGILVISAAILCRVQRRRRWESKNGNDSDLDKKVYP